MNAQGGQPPLVDTVLRPHQELTLIWISARAHAPDCVVFDADQTASGVVGRTLHPDIRSLILEVYHEPVPAHIAYPEPGTTTFARPSSRCGPGDGERGAPACHCVGTVGLALQCDAELYLIHAYEVSSVYLGDVGGDGLALSQLISELRRTQEKTFLELTNLFGVPVERRHFVLGHPVSALSEFALEHEVEQSLWGALSMMACRGC